MIKESFIGHHSLIYLQAMRYIRENTQATLKPIFYRLSILIHKRFHFFILFFVVTVYKKGISAGMVWMILSSRNCIVAPLKAV